MNLNNQKEKNLEGEELLGLCGYGDPVISCGTLKKTNENLPDEGQCPEITIPLLLISSFTSFFSYADYYICSYYLKALISSVCPLYYSEAIGYASGFYGILYFAVISGVQQTVQIYTSQLISTSQGGKINLILRQSILICFGVLFCITLPMVLTQDYVLTAFGVDEKVISLVLYIIIMTFPAMMLRAVTDSSKSMIQGAGKVKELGIANFIIIVALFIYSYLIIVYLDMQLMGYCLCLFLYELSNLIVCLVLYFFLLKEAVRDISLCLFQEFRWYSCECLKMVSAIMYSFVAEECLLLILTKNGCPIQVAAYSVFSNVAIILQYKSMALMALPQNQFNFYLEKGDKGSALRCYIKYCAIFGLEVLIFSIPVNFLLPYTLKIIGANQAVVEQFNGIVVLLMMFHIVMEVQMWIKKVIYSSDLKEHAIWINIAFGVIFTLTFSWIFVIEFEMGLKGIYLVKLLDAIFRMICSIGVVQYYGFSNYKGCKN